ncbi:hypothetical protein K501DRAFT_312419 [Backusella circina FSU 941]|nr:hypothetical protein K501DRAFT_312419 [Backusella circina FSU 941]
MDNTFRYHPSCIEVDPKYMQYKKRPQQWNPFPKSIQFNDILEQPNKKMDKFNISFSEFKKAMLDYLGCLTGLLSPRFIQFHKNQQVDFSERLWSDSLVYSCTAYKEHCSNKTRRDDYCYFTSNHINKNAAVVSNWYVGCIVVFLNFQFLSSKAPSTYALIEPMAINDVASFDSTIPRVKAYPPNSKKYAVIDVGQIDGCVGVIEFSYPTFRFRQK